MCVKTQMYLMSGQCNSERSVGKLLQAFLSTSLTRNQLLEIFWVANDSTGTSCEGMNRRGKNNPGLAVDTLRSAFRTNHSLAGFQTRPPCVPGESLPPFQGSTGIFRSYWAVDTIIGNSSSPWPGSACTVPVPQVASLLEILIASSLLDPLRHWSLGTDTHFSLCFSTHKHLPIGRTDSIHSLYEYVALIS